MATKSGLTCRECGRAYPSGPIHVCDFCFGPLEVAYDYAALMGRVTRESIAAGPPSMWRITGNGLKTPDALTDRLAAHVTIRPTLGAFDHALADLKPRTTQEAPPWP